MTNEFKAIDLDKKDVLWTYEPKRAQPFYGSAAVTDKLVVVGNRDKYIHALDRDKGALVWTFGTKGRVDSSPVIDQGRVYKVGAPPTAISTYSTLPRARNCKNWSWAAASSPARPSPIIVW